MFNCLSTATNSGPPYSVIIHTWT